MPDHSFKEFVLDQLIALPEVRARAMFGGHGLYAGEHFFGILYEGRLFFKTDGVSRLEYEHRGMGPFVYTKSGKTVAMRYFEVPSAVLEDRDELVRWAVKAVQAAEPGEATARSANPRSKPKSCALRAALSVPSDFEAALERMPGARSGFNELSYACRREYLEWIETAKKPATRARRIDQAVAMIFNREQRGKG